MFYGHGINYYNVDKQHTSIHAEVNTVDKLKNTTKRTKVNLFVFRTNKVGENIPKKGYRLYKIYYVDFEGNLQKL
jgi:hypothetical protein